METLFGVPQITPSELKAKMDRGEDIFLLDVREPFEREICAIGGTLIPKGSVTERIAEIPKDKEIVVVCRSGARSQAVALELTKIHGYAQVSNLAGGVLRWADEIDPEMAKY
jgi:adenylyltransferase/sulfurtransferase